MFVIEPLKIIFSKIIWCYKKVSFRCLSLRQSIHFCSFIVLLSVLYVLPAKSYSDEICSHKLAKYGIGKDAEVFINTVLRPTLDDLELHILDHRLLSSHAKEPREIAGQFKKTSLGGLRYTESVDKTN